MPRILPRPVFLEARAAALAVLTVGLLAGWARAGQETALQRYVGAPDTAYEYRPVGTLEGDGYRAHVLEMTSQSWRTPEEVDRTVWKHWVTVVVPRTVRHRTALLYVSGGRSTTPAPAEANPVIARIAVDTGAVAVYLQQVPNQPLAFAGEVTSRREDALIAYAWDRFLRSGDVTWLPRLPMTKSVVRAMDAVVDFCATGEGGGLSIEGFVVAGSSKRGWTTWTTAVVDRRVVAIVPMVIDLLNVETSFRHHYRAYGFWSSAIQDYVDLEIPGWFGTREFHDLTRIEDPYSYRQLLTMPKLIVNATGDPLFLPDSSRFYFARLRGEKHLRYVPNADHSLEGTDAFDSLLAFFREIVEGVPRPELTWRFQGQTAIRVQTGTERRPSEVRLWQASNPNARDFRLETIGAAWTDRLLEPRADGIYVGRVEKPARGWTAFFLELTYPSAGEGPLKLTTAVRVVPDTLPYRGHRTSGPRLGPRPRGPREEKEGDRGIGSPGSSSTASAVMAPARPANTSWCPQEDSILRPVDHATPQKGRRIDLRLSSPFFFCQEYEAVGGFRGSWTPRWAPRTRVFDQTHTAPP